MFSRKCGRRNAGEIDGTAYELDVEWYFGLKDYVSSIISAASEDC